jgi:hypothetical protein
VEAGFGAVLWIYGFAILVFGLGSFVFEVKIIDGYL